jgi:aspartyl-tRNA synthetase
MVDAETSPGSRSNEARDPAAIRETADGGGRTAFRDETCGHIAASWAGRSVRLVGWVHRRRDLGAVIFIHLRDRSGIVQLAFGPEWTPAEALDLAGDLNPEDVISVGGDVVLRPEDAINPDMITGEIEVRVETMDRLAVSEPLPILVAIPPEEELPSEELRLRHRVLDLRRPDLQRNFRIRHQATGAARAALTGEGFCEIETPFLTRRTPEGARDYLVPSRLHPGEFYALPQSPQLYKQLLMVAGFDRYYQIARCMRDEDLRADRQPEFTQIDVEMSFVDEDDVFGVCERMLRRMYREALGRELKVPFGRMAYSEALEKYGTDKPDLRIPWTIRDFTSTLAGIGFGIFDAAAEAGGRVRGFVAKDGAGLSRARLDATDETARDLGARGTVWLKRRADAWSGAPAKFIDGPTAALMGGEHGVEEGDLVLLVAGPDRETAPALDALRRELAGDLGAVAKGTDHWLWVTEFPLFEPVPGSSTPTPTHHPFTMPVDAGPEQILEDPLAVRSRAYDLVLNGTELGSGSIRCHDVALQRAILQVLGLGDQEIDARFGFLLEAFRFGVPPHGGFAMGLDRLIAMMVGAPSIRDVIAFPKTTAARGLMEGAPSQVEQAELEELGIRIKGD